MRQLNRGNAPVFLVLHGKLGGANKSLGEAPKSCTRKEHESATNSIAKRGQGGTSSLFVCPLQGQGTASLVGFGATPQQFHGRPVCQTCSTKVQAASNSARPQTRLQAALPPRFREEPFFSCSFTRLTVIILPSVSFSNSACTRGFRFPPPTPQPCSVAGDFLFPKTTKKAPLTLTNQGLIGIRQRLILPGRVQPSTFSTGELNFCVRDGNRWNLSVIATGNGSYFVSLFCTLTTAHRMIL